MRAGGTVVKCLFISTIFDTFSYFCGMEVMFKLFTRQHLSSLTYRTLQDTILNLISFSTVRTVQQEL